MIFKYLCLVMPILPVREAQRDPFDRPNRPAATTEKSKYVLEFVTQATTILTTKDPKFMDKDDWDNLYNKPPETKEQAAGLNITDLTRPPPTGSAETWSLKDYCDYHIVYCMRAHNTGRICARTRGYKYVEYKNYCTMDYVNCHHRTNMFELAHMGGCLNPERVDFYYNTVYTYFNDNHLDQYYVLNDW